MDGDAVLLPHHYARFPFEPIRFIMENKLEFWQGNVIKYVMRYDAKNGIEDLRKAIRQIEMQIKKLEGDVDFWKAEAPKTQEAPKVPVCSGNDRGHVWVMVGRSHYVCKHCSMIYAA